MPLMNTEFLDVKGYLKGGLWWGAAVTFSAA